MEGPHPTRELLARVTEGELPEATAWRVAVEHLAAACPECRLAVERLGMLVRDRLRRHPEEEPVAWRLGRLGLGDPRRLAPGAYRRARRNLRKLRALPPGERGAKVARSRTRFRSAAQVELLIEEGRGELHRDPRAALGWLELAREVAIWLGAAGYDPEVVDELAMRVRAHRANALRVAGELGAADALFTALRDDRRVGTAADPALHAEIDSLEASLRQDQRLFADSEALLARAAGLYRATVRKREEGRVLLKCGMSKTLRGNPASALPDLERASELLATEPDSELYLAARHGAATALCDLGRAAKAARILETHRALYDRYPGIGIQGPRRWVEARVASTLGREEEAERLFSAARDRYLEADLPLDAALVSIDLADLYLAQGRTAEVRRLAEAMAPILQAQGIHRDALAAFALFQKAAAAERATGDLLARLRQALGPGRSAPRPRKGG